MQLTLDFDQLTSSVRVELRSHGKYIGYAECVCRVGDEAMTAESLMAYIVDKSK